MRIDHSIDRSRLWIESLGAVGWLGGAALSAAWLLHGGGIVRPLAVFAVWAVGVCFGIVRALDMAPDAGEAMKKALSYGGYSVVVLVLGILFVEYWPVTMSMAFMFAICRTIKSEDTPAYG